MKKRKRREQRRTGESALQIARASLLSCILTAVLVLLLACMIQWEWLGVDRIHVLNTLIKAISASFAGVLIALGARVKERGWLLAGIAGTAYILLSYVAFSLIERDFSVSWLFLSDLLLGFLCAAIMQVFVRVLKEMRAQE